VNFTYGDALSSADRLVFFKMAASEIARAHGLIASFMPKPFSDRTGTGTHFHLSLGSATSKNLFHDDSDRNGLGLSQSGYHFLAASLSRYPLEGYRERCSTKTVLGTRFATKPIELAIPITVAGMSFGSLSANVKDALGRAATEAGTSTTTGDGGMLLGQKVNPPVAAMRTLPEGVDQRSACRRPDWSGPDNLAIKIRELREITDWEKPIYVKVGATRTFHDVKLAVHAGADVVVVDGMQGGTAATQTVFDVSCADDYAALGTAPGFCHHCHTGRCPVGVTTQDAVREQRLQPPVGARRVRNYLKTMAMEVSIIARACGKQDVHHREREDLVALTVEAAAMAGVPLAGTNWIPGR